MIPFVKSTLDQVIPKNFPQTQTAVKGHGGDPGHLGAVLAAGHPATGPLPPGLRTVAGHCWG